MSFSGDFKKYIRDISDFPKKGIIFKDITPLLKDPSAFKALIELLTKRYESKNIDYVIAVEARGFILGAALAYSLGVGFIPVRKEGKLPAQVCSISYQLEYGVDTLEIHKNDIETDSRIVIIDDVLATGGTISAVVNLLDEMQATIIEIAFLIELTFLNGREKLAQNKEKIFSFIEY
ncbi:adenine phosphoribosyltransferase [Chlamydiota bacterium]